MMSDKKWVIDLQNITDTLKSVIEKMRKSASRSLKKSVIAKNVADIPKIRVTLIFKKSPGHKNYYDLHKPFIFTNHSPVNSVKISNYTFSIASPKIAKNPAISDISSQFTLAITNS